jgi:hypothetical protein
MGQTEFIFGDDEREVCDGAHSPFVMKKSGRFKNSLYAAGVPTLCKERKEWANLPSAFYLFLFG